MIDVRVFQMFGFLVERQFLTREECERLRGDMRRAAAEAAGVVHHRGDVVDLGHRSTKRVSVSDASYSLIEERLAALRPRLVEHFHVELTGMQPPQFLRYGAGDFFRCHADTSDRPGAPDYLAVRKISTIIFLGHPADDAPAEGPGGELVFHGLIDDQRMQNRGFAFPPDEGTFLAFPSTAMHEVKTITAGERYSVVTWFY